MQPDDVSILRIRTPPPDQFFDDEEESKLEGLRQKSRVAMTRLICLVSTTVVATMLLYLAFRE